MVYKLIIFAIAVFIVLAMLPSIIYATDGLENVSNQFTAIGNGIDETEVVTLTYSPYVLLVTGDVIVDGVELVEGVGFTQDDVTITIGFDYYSTDDVIVITYVYDSQSFDFARGLVDLIPVLIVIGLLVASPIMYLKYKRK